jgi:hypothetical protein
LASPILLGMQRKPLKRVYWRKEPNPNLLREKNRLLPVEEENVRRAMTVLHLRFGNWTRVAKAIGAHRVTVERVLNIRRRATPAFAMRVARLLGVPLGDVLSGAFPAENQCAFCGRVTGGFPHGTP